MIGKILLTFLVIAVLGFTGLIALYYLAPEIFQTIPYIEIIERPIIFIENLFK